jgi:hypothetical protein
VPVALTAADRSQDTQVVTLSACRYSIIVLIVECVGISAVIPYGVINVCHTHPSGSLGLPADDGTLLPDKT